MYVSVTEIEDGTPAELFSLLAGVEENEFVTELSHVAAELERSEDDQPLYNRIAAAVLAEGYVASAGLQVDGSDDRSLPRLFRRANGIPSRLREDISQADLSEHNCRMMVRTLAQHEAYLGPLKPALARTEILFGQLLPEALRGRQSPLAVLPGLAGATYQEVRSLFLGCYAWVIGQAGAGRVPLVRRQDFSSAVDPERLWEVAARYALTRAELHSRRNSRPGYGFKSPTDFRHSFSILRDVPFVRLSEGDLAVPIVRHLGLAFSDGVYDFLAAHAEAKGETREFDEIFGDTAEAYVRARFEREFGKEGYRRLPEIGDGQLSPDGIAGEDCIVEVKGRRLLRGIITTGNLRAAPYFLGGRRGLVKGVAQLLSELGRVRAGRGRGVARDGADDVVLCLVTPDGLPGFHLAPVRNWVLAAIDEVIRREFPELANELEALRRFEWLSFDELDRLCRSGRIAGCSIGRLLRRFRFEAELRDPFDRNSSRFSPSIREWLLGRYPQSNDDPWFEDSFAGVWSDCTKRFFGADVIPP